MSEKWFYAVDGKSSGPVDGLALRALASERKLQPADLVWRKGMPAWVEASSVDELRAAFPPETDVPALTIPPLLPESARAKPAVDPLIAVPPAAPPNLPPRAASEQWFHCAGGVQQGPMSFDDLRAVASRGALAARDLVWKVGTPGWVEAGSVADLVARSPEKPAPVPVPALAPNRPRPAPAKPMNKWLYISFVAFAPAAAMLLFLVGFLLPPVFLLAVPLAVAAMVAAVVFWSLFVHRMWSAIQDGVTTPTAGAAVGLGFIPFFNLYWVFRVMPGFVDQFNAYTARHGIASAQLDKGLYLTLAICVAASIVPGIGYLSSLVCLVIAPMVISKTCDAINAMHAGRLGAAASLGAQGMQAQAA